MRSVLIVDDYAPARELFTEVISKAFGDIELTEATTLVQARVALQKKLFDLALLDVTLPDGCGMELVTELAEYFPHTYRVIVTYFDDDQHLFSALRAGAHGYLLKESPLAEQVKQLQGILEGRPPLSPSITRRILRYFHETTLKVNESTLTSRENDILTMMAKGLNRSEMGASLGISVNTVAEYIKGIYRKLNINTRSEATIEAVRRGLISAEA